MRGVQKHSIPALATKHIMHMEGISKSLSADSSWTSSKRNWLEHTVQRLVLTLVTFSTEIEDNCDCIGYIPPIIAGHYWEKQRGLLCCGPSEKGTLKSPKSVQLYSPKYANFRIAWRNDMFSIIISQFWWKVPPNSSAWSMWSGHVYTAGLRIQVIQNERALYIHTSVS